MRITVDMIDLKGTPIKGVIQVGAQAVQTSNGFAVFDDLSEGTYVVRGLARGYRLESKIVHLVDEDLFVVIEAR